MDHKCIIDELDHNRTVFDSLLLDVSEKQILWKPGPDKWSILEIVNHLYDEEREDFRLRLSSTLEDPVKPWPAIAPEKWVFEREYANRDFQTSLSNFMEERDNSVKWLRGLSSPQWQKTHDHPTIGKMSAEMILANWLAHDYLHFRQIVQQKYTCLLQTTASINLEYAGIW